MGGDEVEGWGLWIGFRGQEVELWGEGVQGLGRGRRSGLSGGLGCRFEAGPVGCGLGCSG